MISKEDIEASSLSNRSKRRVLEIYRKNGRVQDDELYRIHIDDLIERYGKPKKPLKFARRFAYV